MSDKNKFQEYINGPHVIFCLVWLVKILVFPVSFSRKSWKSFILYPFEGRFLTNRSTSVTEGFQNKFPRISRLTMICYREVRIIISNLKEINSGDPMLLVLWESDITFLIKSTRMMRKIKIILCIHVSGLYLCGKNPPAIWKLQQSFYCQPDEMIADPNRISSCDITLDWHMATAN